VIASVRIVLVEDHALVRSGIRRLLEDMLGIEVVGEAADGREALELVETMQPDVVLMDITMPGLNGLGALGQMVRSNPGVKIVMLSMHDNEEYVAHALRAGAAGYLLKDAAPGELELCVRAVARGGSYLSPEVSRHIVSDFVRHGGAERSPLERLTPRQVEILQLIAEGNSNREIARILEVSVKTVETHRGQLMQRLDLHDAAGIVRYAVRTGLVTADG
jgi:DNA-binding NarL/FixJ family response regulator